MPRFNAFSRNVNTINLEIVVTHAGIYKISTSILERNIALRSLKKYDTMYP